MTRRTHWVVVLLLTLASATALAAISAYEFRNADDRHRFQRLTQELRCPKCQNNNIADSNAPIAQDMRDRVFEMINEGKSDQEIVDFMVARYGEFVKYTPRKDASTAVLWYGPVVLLLIGLAVVALIARRRSRARAASEAAEVDRERLRKLLEKG